MSRRRKMASSVIWIYLFLQCSGHAASGSAEILSFPGTILSKVDDDVTFVWRITGQTERILIKTDHSDVMQWNHGDVWINDNNKYTAVRDSDRVGFTVRSVRSGDAGTVYRLVIYPGPLYNDNATLAVEKSPSDPIISLDPNIPLLEGHPLTLKCESNVKTVPRSAARRLVYTWERINQAGESESAGPQLEHVSGPTLVIYSMSRHTRRYRCTVREQGSTLSVATEIRLQIQLTTKQTDPAGSIVTSTASQSAVTVDEDSSGMTYAGEIITVPPRHEDFSKDAATSASISFLRYGLGPLLGILVIVLLIVVLCRVFREQKHRDKTQHLESQPGHIVGDAQIKSTDATVTFTRGATNTYDSIDQDVYTSLDDNLLVANAQIKQPSAPPLPPDRDTASNKFSVPLSHMAQNDDDGYLTPQTSGNSVRSLRPCLPPPPGQQDVTDVSQPVSPSGESVAKRTDQFANRGLPQTGIDGSILTSGSSVVTPGEARTKQSSEASTDPVSPKKDFEAHPVSPKQPLEADLVSPDCVYAEPDAAVDGQINTDDDNNFIYGNKRDLSNVNLPQLLTNASRYMQNRTLGGSTSDTQMTADTAMCRHPLLEQHVLARQNSYLVVTDKTSASNTS